MSQQASSALARLRGVLRFTYRNPAGDEVVLVTAGLIDAAAREIEQLQAALRAAQGSQIRMGRLIERAAGRPTPANEGKAP